jgi:serine/threonine-protein kinase RsbW
VTALSESAEDTAGGDLVEVRVPADVAYVATLRLMAASLGARCDLTIDDIEDLRLAVDEACALLLPHAAPDARLEATFVLRPGALSVAASVASVGGAQPAPDRGGFAWSVLSALSSEVDVASTEGRLAITVTKRRETASR